MGGERYASWGRFPAVSQQGKTLAWRTDPLPEPCEGTATLLPFGNGRSYGDVCLNRGGTVLSTAALRHFIAFDADTGVLRCESGVTLQDIQRFALPQGWMLEVSPGTAHVTVGGAVANDVHGKNHHKAGSFGCAVRAFELLRSDGERLVCTPHANSRLFGATIGGMGLTGLLTWVELQLRKVVGPWLREDSLKFSNLDAFFKLSDASADDFEYTVSWIDCLAAGESLGRGLFSRANHAAEGEAGRLPRRESARFALPVAPPFSLVNNLSLRLFNAFWYARQRERRVSRTTHYSSFFYPLDAIANWNLMYGPRGMLQYQCVLPGTDGRAAMQEMLRTIAASGRGSFLAVLKVFGDVASPGMLSFPREGVTLALDFPNQPDVFRLLDRLDAMTLEVGGAVYPAKDARMSAATFRAGFPQWEAFSEFVDPAFSSSFWRRVAGDGI